MKKLSLLFILLAFVPHAHATAAVAPTCTLAASSYTGPQQIGPCTDANTGTKIQCATIDGTTPVTNGLGTGCTTGWALVSPSYYTVGASETFKIVAGTSTLTDSTVTSLAYTITAAAILPDAFGKQCAVNATNCALSGSTITWPTSIAYPLRLRLWDAGISATLGSTWGQIESSSQGSYNWQVIDAWLDTIAAQVASNPWTGTQSGPTVMFTFGFVSCQRITACRTGVTPCASTKGCSIPPDDLPLPSGSAWNGTGALPAGSQSYSDFVTALLGRCNINGKCFSALVKNYELWNEPNLAAFWAGTEAQIYQMAAPIAVIIRANVTGAKIYSASSASNATYASTWMALENTYGRISDAYAFHHYLNSTTPESNYTSSTVSMVAALAANAGWTNTPYRMTETGGLSSTPPFACDTATFTTADCISQPIRWHLVQMSNGMEGIDYYSWYVNIGSQSNFAGPYYRMMQYLVGGKLTSPCTSSGSPIVYTCAETEANGTIAQWVWAPCTPGAGYTACTAGTTYTVPAGYTQYRDLTGSLIPVAAASSVAIGVQPIMLEQVAALPAIAPAFFADLVFPQ